MRYIIQMLIILSCLIPSLGFANEALDERLKAHIHYNSDGPNTVGHLYIGDHSTAISQSTWLYVKTGLDYYKKTKPAFIILELDSPGGEVFAAQLISDALKNIDIQNDIPVVAFINNWAISAGAMLAYSSRFIVIAKDASMGAAEPIITGTSGETKEASEKINSAIRSDFANRARFFDRNPYIAEGMVDKDIILVMRDGEIIKIDSEAQVRTVPPKPDILVKAKGKLLTLTADQMMQYKVADMLLSPAKLVALTEAEKTSGKWPADKSLLFQQPFFSKIPQATIDSYRMDWKTQFFVFLANPIVASILMLGLMMGFYMEISTPGAVLPGTIGFISLFLIALSSLSLEIANWLELILLFSGMLIILIDFFILPTFGILGIFGAILFIVGLFGLMLPEINSVDFDYNTKTLNAAGEAFLNHLAWLCGTLIVGIGGILLLGRYVTPKFTTWSNLVLHGNEQEASKGYIAGLEPDQLPKPGAKGIAYSMLRPTGKVLIDQRIYDATSSGNYIEQGANIVVKRIEGNDVVVDYEKSDQSGYQASNYNEAAIGKKGIVVADLKPGGYILIDGMKQQAISQSGYVARGAEVQVIGGEADNLIVIQTKIKKEEAS